MMIPDPRPHLKGLEEVSLFLTLRRSGGTKADPNLAIVCHGRYGGQQVAATVFGGPEGMCGLWQAMKDRDTSENETENFHP
jgi:hypothetical protein